MEEGTRDFVCEQEKILLSSISTLNSIVLDDDAPNLQHAFANVEMSLETVENPVRFVDRAGYSASYSVEIGFLSEIDGLLDQGQYFINMLYTFRSVSKAIPEVVIEVPEGAGPEDEAEVVAKRNEVNSKIIGILRPGMVQVKELISFVNTSIDAFHRCLAFLAGATSNDFNASEFLFSSLVRLLDLLIKLDNLKDMKASLLSDFARYKRAFGTKLSPENVEEITILQSFLSNFDSRKAKNFIFNTLKDEVKRVRGHEDTLAAIIEQVLYHLESEMFLTPDEKFRLLRVLPHLLLLIDGNVDDPKSLNVFTFKKLRLPAIQKVFKKHPVTPLCGDMSMTLVYVLERSKHFDRANMAAQWSETGTGEAKVAADHSLLTHWKDIRASYTSLSVRLAATLNRLEQYPFTKSDDAVTVEAAADAFDLAFVGARSLSSWATRVFSALAWKYTHPCSATQLAIQSQTHVAAMNGEGVEYEQVIRFNLSKEELSVFVDVISMIKSLDSALQKAENVLAPLIRFHIHHRVQQLVQGDLVPVTHRVDKRNKPAQVTMLLQMRSLVADWFDGEVPGEEFYKNYRKTQGIAEVKHPARVVGPNCTQLHLLRLFVGSLCFEGASIRQKNGLMGKADLEKDELKMLEQFYFDSYFYAYLLSFSDTLRSVGDMADLWYREFYLELTRCIQFPIEMSIPWILTEHIIAPHSSGEAAPLVEDVLFILDIYNDAAHRALFVLNQQYLYDEVEAEANLVLDQLIFLLSDEIFAYYKEVASTAILDQALKQKLEEMKGQPYLTVSRRRFEIALAQRHINLLGRTVDLNFLIGQHVNNKFYRDIDVALKKFESADVGGLVELDTALRLLKKLHELLSRHLSLDPFHCLFGEVDESFAPTVFRGRILLHTMKSIVQDVIPNFSYNFFTQRFVRSPIPIRPLEYAKAPKSAALSALYGAATLKTHEATFKLTRSFVGRPHWEAFVSVLGYKDLAVLIQETLGHLKFRLEDVAAYIEALKEGIPPCKLPKYMFRAGGCYGYFCGKLKSVLEYDDLKPEVFQDFREIGNVVALLRDLSEFLDVTDQLRFMIAAPLLGVPADCVVTPDVDSTPLGAVLQQLSKASSAQALFGQKELKSNGKNASGIAISSPVVAAQLPVLAKQLVESLSDAVQVHSLMAFVFSKVKEMMYHFNLFVDWGSGDNIDVVEVENAQGFHRLWSALNFLFCIQEAPQASGSDDQELVVSDEDEFGHGFAIAGCLFLHLLHQRHMFELMDFSYHVINVHVHDTLALSQSTQVGKVDNAFQQETDRFVASASAQRQLHMELFGYFTATCSSDEEVSDGRKVSLFHPPADV